MNGKLEKNICRYICLILTHNTNVVGFAIIINMYLSTAMAFYVIFGITWTQWYIHPYIKNILLILFNIWNWHSNTRWLFYNTKSSFVRIIYLKWTSTLQLLHAEVSNINKTKILMHEVEQLNAECNAAMCSAHITLGKAKV